MNTTRTFVLATLLAGLLGLSPALHAEEPAADSLAKQVATLVKADASPDAAVEALQSALNRHGGEEAWFGALFAGIRTLQTASYTAEARTLFVSWAAKATPLSKVAKARLLAALGATLEPGASLETPIGVAVARLKSGAPVVFEGTYDPRQTGGTRSPLEKKIRAAMEPLILATAQGSSVQNEVSTRVARAFRGIGPEALPILSQIAREANPVVTRLVVRMIAENGGVAATSFLEGLVFNSEALTRAATLESLRYLNPRSADAEAGRGALQAWLISVEKRVTPAERRELWQRVILPRITAGEAEAHYKSGGEFKFDALGRWLTFDSQVDRAIAAVRMGASESRDEERKRYLVLLRDYLDRIGHDRAWAVIKVGIKTYCDMIDEVVLPYAERRGAFSELLDPQSKLRVIDTPRKKAFLEAYYRWLWSKFTDEGFSEIASQRVQESIWEYCLSSRVLPTEETIASESWQRHFGGRLDRINTVQAWKTFSDLGVRSPTLFRYILSLSGTAVDDQHRDLWVANTIHVMAQMGRQVPWDEILIAPGQLTGETIRRGVRSRAAVVLEWAIANKGAFWSASDSLGWPGVLWDVACWPNAQAQDLFVERCLAVPDRFSLVLGQNSFRRAPVKSQERVVLGIIEARDGAPHWQALPYLNPTRHRNVIHTLYREARESETPWHEHERRALVTLARVDASDEAVAFLMAMYTKFPQAKEVSEALDAIRAHRERLASFESWLENDGQDETAALLESLKSDEAATRRAAILALTAMESRKALPAFVRMSTKDSDPEVRAAALHALERMAGLTK